jgi:hypothetical protein
MGGNSSKPKESEAAKARRRNQEATDKMARQARLRRAFAGSTNTFAEKKRDEIQRHRQFSLAMADRHPVNPQATTTMQRGTSAPRRQVKSAMKTGRGGRRTRRKRHTKRRRRRHTKRRRKRHGKRHRKRRRRHRRTKRHAR